MRNTNKFHFFFHFSKLFLKLLFPLPRWSNYLLVESLQVAGGQFRNPPVYFGLELWLGQCFFWGSVQAGDDINWPLTPRDVYRFKNACKWSLACMDLSETVKAVLVPSRRASAFVMRGLRGFIAHTCLLLDVPSPDRHYNLVHTGCSCGSVHLPLVNISQVTDITFANFTQASSHA